MKATLFVSPLVSLALCLLPAGGCRSQPAPAPVAPPPAPALPPAPPGLPVTGLVQETWDRPLADCLREHRERRGGECRKALLLTVNKAARQMVLTCDGEPVKAYFIALGFTPAGAKERRGDYRTPEGEYRICGRNPNSRFTLGLALNYPNAEDGDRGVRQGLISRSTRASILSAERRHRKPPQDTRLGGDIFLHGGGVGTVVEQDGREYIRIRDWTWGCIALRDQDIRELYALLPMGTRVKIEP